MIALACTRALVALTVATSSVAAPAAAPEAESSDAPATPAATESASPTTTASAGEDPSIDAFSAWRLRLDGAVTLTNDDPAAGVSGLAAALAEAPRFTVELANDAAARSDRNNALLALSRAYLTLGDGERAAETMFEAQRSAGSDPLSPDRFGPSLADFYAQQRRALESAGKAAITVECAVPCRVYLNEHPAAASSNGLPLGTYRLHIEASTGDAEIVAEKVKLTTPDETIRVLYPPRSASAPEGPASDPAAATGGPDTAKKPKRKRVLPKWLEITAIIGGAAAIGAGTALYMIDARCVGDLNVTPTADNPGTCADIYNSRAGAFAAIGVGAFALLGGVVTLSIDASRARKSRDDAAGKSAMMIGYTRRF